VRYDVSIRSAESWTLDVRATFEGGVERGRIAFPPAVSDVVVIEADGRERRPEQHGRAFLLGCASTCVGALLVRPAGGRGAHERRA
jgi:hypothetical protein